MTSFTFIYIDFIVYMAYIKVVLAYISFDIMISILIGKYNNYPKYVKCPFAVK